jgi:hypothetical protein
MRHDAAEFGQRAVAVLKGDETGAVGGDADAGAAGEAGALGEIVRQAGFDVGQLATQVAFVFEDGVADQGVQASVDFRQADFVIGGGVGEAEALGQDGADGGADMLMARPGEQALHEFGEVGAAPMF